MLRQRQRRQDARAHQGPRSSRTSYSGDSRAACTAPTSVHTGAATGQDTQAPPQPINMGVVHKLNLPRTGLMWIPDFNPADYDWSR